MRMITVVVFPQLAEHGQAIERAASSMALLPLQHILMRRRAMPRARRGRGRAVTGGPTFSRGAADPRLALTCDWKAPGPFTRQFPQPPPSLWRRAGLAGQVHRAASAACKRKTQPATSGRAEAHHTADYGTCTEEGRTRSLRRVPRYARCLPQRTASPGNHWHCAMTLRIHTT
jgi:hypothetical protein